MTLCSHFSILPPAPAETALPLETPAESPGTSPDPQKTTDEILKNFLAGMTYVPQAVQLPEDPEGFLAYVSPLLPGGLGPGTDAHIDLPDPVAAPSQTAQKARPRRLSFSKPVLNAVISSRYGMRWGRMHQGVDLAVPMGTAIQASEAGRITYSGSAAGYGNLVIIDHGGGITTRYGHASQLLVRAGQKVKKGQRIALAGSTGHATGPHLHFEVLTQGRHQNPLAYINRTIDLAAVGANPVH